MFFNDVTYSGRIQILIRERAIEITYSFQQLLTFIHVIDFFFSQSSLFLQKDLEKNDTLFESPKIEHLDSGKKFGMATPRGWPRLFIWKSITSTKTCLEPFKAKILTISRFFQTRGNMAFFFEVCNSILLKLA